MRKIISLIFIITLLFLSCKEKNEHENCEQKCSETDTTQHQFYGFILKLTEKENNNFIVVDSIEYYTKEEAEKQFKIDNPNTKQFDNIFYIRNLQENFTDFKIADEVEIITQTFFHNDEGNFEFNKKITLTDFITFIKSGEWARFRRIPFELILKCGQIIRIKEIYIP